MIGAVEGCEVRWRARGGYVLVLREQVVREIVCADLLVEMIVVEVLVVVVSCVAVWGPYASPSQARSVHHIAVHGVAWPHNPSTASVGIVEQDDWSGCGRRAAVGID